MQNQQFTEIEQLFEKARQNGGFEYLNTLVRIDGIQLHADYKDQLLALRDWLDRKKPEDPLESYRYLISLDDPLKLLQNLVNNSNGQHYHVSPFLPLAKGAYPNAIWPTLSEKIEALSDGLSKAGFPALADRLVKSYPRNWPAWPI